MNYSTLCVVFGCVVVSACGGSASETAGGAGSGGASSGSAGATASGGSAGSTANGGSLGNTTNGGSVGNTTDGGSAGATTTGGGPSVGAAGQGGAATISEGPCKPITACGGNVVGTWHVSELCTPNLMANQAAATCPNETVSISALTENGTYTFNADDSTLDNVHLTFTETVLFPAACVTEAQCTELESAFGTTAGVTSATCSYAATACSCLMTIDTQASSVGSYQINGSNITLTASANATPENDTFCVSGNTLTIQNVNADGAVANLTLTK